MAHERSVARPIEEARLLGVWGHLLDAGVDYLCLEALAELTLAILQKDRARDETLGYTRDLPRYLGAAMPAILDGRTKVITNSGGINPRAAAHAAIATATQMGGSGLKVGAAKVGGQNFGEIPANWLWH